MVWSVPGTSRAQNLLTNSQFVFNTSGWLGSGWWTTDDCFGVPKSGSATYVNEQTGPYDIFIVRQCVELPMSGQSYQVSGYFLIPALQSGTGRGKLGVAWHSSAGCTPADYIGGADAPSVTATGLWRKTSAVFKAPFEAVSAYFYTSNFKLSGGGTFQVSTDNLSFVMEDPIFSDGFESGDTTEWSAAVP